MKKQTMHKRGIRRKVILIICLSTLTVMAIGVGLGYFFGFNMLHDMVGDVHRKMSQLLASHISEIFDAQIEKVKSYSRNPLWIEAVIRDNLKYETMEVKDITSYATDMDSKWVSSATDSPLLKEYLGNEVSVKLGEAVKEDKNIVKIAIFDKFGCLVAASGKTGNFYRPSESRQGQGPGSKSADISIGGIEFDEVSNAWIFPIAVPIQDRNGGVIGMYNVEISTARFFASLENFRVDDTGHAVMVDGEGNVMFHPGISRTNVPLCSKADYEKLLTDKRKYGTIYQPSFHKEKTFVAFSEVMSPLLLENGIVWRVFIDQDAKEVFAPLNKILFWMVAAVGFLIMIMIFIGFIFSGVLVRPIERLYEAAVQIMKGDWDYKIDVKTGDEIEQFADAFKEMIANIKGKQEEVLLSKSALEELSQSLERKVEERTKDLTVAKNELGNYTKELEKALMVKSDFISMASHELRTPLTAIKEGIAIVLEGKVGILGERQKEFLSMSKRNVDRLGRLINDILDLQKLEQGKVVFKMEEHDINDVINEVVKIMTALAAEKSLRLSTKPEEGLPKIKFDKDKITQVLTNLVNNAVKFTEKGDIVISTARGGNFIQVSVRDTGQGIKEDEMSNLFQKFTQLERGLERKTGGSGLGLTISKGIVEKHRGKMWAESKFGEGSVFHFILPIRERRGLESE